MRPGETGQDIHAECRRRIAALEAENAELKKQVRFLLRRVEALEARLGQNSQNSSKPPSSDPPSAPAPPSKLATGRKPGGQPGHQGHQRELLPPEQVDQFVVLKPKQCAGCGQRLRGQDAEPLRHQVTELPQVKAKVIEFQLHRLVCPDCGRVNLGELPAGESESCFGPRVEATVAYLSGRMHLSKRQIQEMLSDLFGITISLGAISTLEQRVSRALREPYREVQNQVQKEPMAHADETGFRQGPKRAWVWVAVTMAAVLFKIHLKRSAKAARQLLGTFQGILITDRWSAYNAWDPAYRQLCWAHLIRDFKGFLDYSGASARIGQALLDQVELMFRWWYRVRDGTLKFSSFQTYMGPVRHRIEELLEQGARCRTPKTAGMCREMLKLAPALWTFVLVEGIEPTNNMAEREIRQMVLYRKISFGTHSAKGSRFVERIMTAVATLRYQGRHVFGYLEHACRAARLGEPVPSLLPHRAAA